MHTGRFYVSLVVRLVDRCPSTPYNVLTPRERISQIVQTKRSFEWLNFMLILSTHTLATTVKYWSLRRSWILHRTTNGFFSISISTRFFYRCCVTLRTYRTRKREPTGNASERAIEANIRWCWWGIKQKPKRISSGSRLIGRDLFS